MSLEVGRGDRWNVPGDIGAVVGRDPCVWRGQPGILAPAQPCEAKGFACSRRAALASSRDVPLHGHRRKAPWLIGAIPAALVAILLAAEPALVSAEWTAKPTGDSACVLESAPESLSDGYQTTSAHIRVDGKTVSVLSPSVFDAGFNDIRMVVDGQEFVPMDRLADPRTAVFETRYAALVDQFKRGRRATVQLRFWPTWPVTGTHPVTFSLIGFTRAYSQLRDCR